MQPHHVGYLVKSIEKAAACFEQLGYTREGDTVYDPYRDIDICFLSNGGYRVELVRAVSEKSVVYGLSKKVGVMPYHICYEVEDVQKEGAALREQGYLPMGEAAPAPAIGNVPAAFFYHRQLGIVELIGKEEG